MKTVVIHAPLDLRIEDSEVTAPKAGEVQVQIERGGICGSDLHYYHHGGMGAIRLREPMILGHEVSGTIAALGAGVTDLQVGQRVAVSPSRPCHACRYCHSGALNHCLNMRFYGSAMPFPHIQGAFRQVLNAGASQCAAADGLTAGEAAMAEPLAVCLHGAAQAGDLLGRRVLITGCGPIGMLCLTIARAAGAAEAIITDIAPFPLAKAREIGADAALNMVETPDALDGYGADKGHFDVLFECTGVAQALAGAIPALRPGATVVQLGLGGDMTLPVQAMTAKELIFKGSFRFHPEFFTGVDLMRQGRLDVKPLITHAIPLADAKAGFDLAGDRSQAIKAQLDFA